VEHKAAKAVPVAKQAQLAHDILHAAPAHLAPKDGALRGLAIAAVVHAAAPRDHCDKGGRQFLHKGRLGRVHHIALVAPFVGEKIVVRVGDLVQVGMRAGDHPLQRLAASQAVQGLWEGFLPFAQEDMVYIGAIQQLLGHDRRMGPAHHGHNTRVHLSRHAQTAHPGVIVGAHHGHTHHVRLPLDQHLAKMLPALERPEVNQVHLMARSARASGQDGQAVANPTRIHPLSDAIESLAHDAGVDQANLHLILRGAQRRTTKMWLSATTSSASGLARAGLYRTGYVLPIALADIQSLSR